MTLLNKNLNSLKKFMNAIRQENENHLSDIYGYLVSNIQEPMKVDYILDKKTEYGTIEMKALVHNEEDASLLYEVEMDNCGNAEHFIVPDWDFNVDDYLLADLQEGYQIAYMPLEEHAGHWYCINELRGEIYAEEGLQMYLSYCHEHGITRELLSATGNEVPYIQDMYQEVNNNYKIIAEVSIGNNAVVLGHSKTAPLQYASWETTRNRNRGFHQGRYFNNYNAAFTDFRKRCHEEADRKISIEKDRSKPAIVKHREKHDGER